MTRDESLNTPRVAQACSAILAFLSFIAIAIAASWADGGHLSTDSIQQVYEAATGRSVSWSPPFMSAVIAALGSGEVFNVDQATSRFVLMVVLLLWGGLFLVAVPRVLPSAWPLRLVVAAALMLNPVLLVYAGIVWKDVLFSAFIAAGIGLSLLALSCRRPLRRALFAAASMVPIALLPEVRQHGQFIAPVLGLLPLMAAWWSVDMVPRRRFFAVAALVVLAIGLNACAGHWSKELISADPAQSTSVGFRSIFAFDLAGIERRVEIGPLRADGLAAAGDEELARTYTPDRIDFLDQSPVLSAHYARVSNEAMADIWFGAVTDHPWAYARHRLRVTQRLLGGGEGGVCLPVHLGVAGLPHQVSGLGLVEAIDSRDARVYSILKPWFDTPVFFHGAYLLALMLVAATAWLMPFRSRMVYSVVCSAGLLYYASFTVTGIACDFRYLVPGLVTATMAVLAVVMGWRESSELEVDRWR